MLGFIVYYIAWRLSDKVSAISGSLMFHLSLPSTDIALGVVALCAVVVGTILIGSDMLSWIRARRGHSPAELLGKNPIPQTKTSSNNERLLSFLLTSTTDWFEIEIKDGNLISVKPATIRKGKMKLPESQPDHFHVNHNESPELKATIPAIFRVPSGTVYCVLRKGDTGHLKVDVYKSVVRSAGTYDYTGSPQAKNEVAFPLSL
jgi:hypothetical protein